MRCKLLFSCFTILLTAVSFAQCDEGEVPVHVMVDTDNWGYELYWEITPEGNDCGNGTIASGGNAMSVGCDTEDDGDEEDEGAYPNNEIILDGPFCLTEGNNYTLHHRDGYGDGGNNLTVYDQEVLTTVLNGEGFSNEITFTAGATLDGPENELSCDAIEVEVDGEGLLTGNTGAHIQLEEPYPPLVYCSESGFWCGSDNGATASIWLKFTAPESQNVEISTCNDDNGFDTQLALYEVGDCTDFSTYDLLGSNDDVPESCDSGSSSYASTMQVTCLNPGEEYYIQLDGWNGGTGDTRVTVISLEDTGTPETLSLLENDINCFGDQSGSIATQVWPNGGVNYDVEWAGPNEFEGSGYYINNLPAGEYTATVTNSCGLDLTATAEITQPEPFLVASNVEDAGCNDSGSIELIVDGASPPYEFEWAFEGEEFSEEQNISGLGQGEYYYSIEDDNGCFYNGSITVEPGENPFSFNLGPDTIICTDQELLLSGPPGIDYEWQDGSTNQFYIVDGNELGSGTFFFTLVGQNDEGCESTDAVLVTVVNCTNVEDYFASDSRSLFPNPTNGHFTLANLPEINNGWMRILNGNGKTVFREKLDNAAGEDHQVNATELAPGMYFLQVNDGSRMAVTKLIIQ